MIRRENDFIGTLLHDVARRTRQLIDARLKEKNLTRLKWLALGVIAENPGLQQSELARKLELGSAATGKLVERLMERGFIERTHDEADGRAYNLRITPKAQSLIRELAPLADEIRRDVLVNVDESELEAARRVLLKIKRNLSDRAAIVLAAALAFLLTAPAAGFQA